MVRAFACLVLIHSLVACGGGGDGSANSVPTVRIECSSAQVADCALDDKPVFVGLIEDLAMNCDNTLRGLNASQRQQLFTISGAATSSRSGIYLAATVSSWVNSTGGAQDTLNPGTYRVCAFVDTNSNGQLDATEPVGSGETGAGGSYYILSNWTAGT